MKLKPTIIFILFLLISIIPFSCSGKSTMNTTSIKTITITPSPKTIYPAPSNEKNTIDKNQVNWVHIGYVNVAYGKCIMFQDGFSVCFSENIRSNLLPSTGAKIEIKYRYDATNGKNILISILPVS